MNKVYSLLAVLAFSTLSASAGVIVLEGNYQGRNLFVQNPFASSGVGFCVYEVTINGQVTTDEINSSAFEIDFSFFQLALGSAVEVKIKYKDDCKPRVLNEFVLQPMSTFNIDAFAVKDGSLLLTTKNETGPLPFIIEQKRWNKWVEVGTIQGKGSADINKYEFKLGTIHSGENIFRSKQMDASGKPRIDDIVAKYKSPLPPVTFNENGKKVSTSLSFSDNTMYEIFNNYGNIVLKGIGKTVDVSKLDRGDYQINFDNTFGTFKK